MFDNYGHSQPQTPASPPPKKTLQFDRGYVTTFPGVLKLVQLASNLLGFICIKVSWGVWISSIFYNILYWFGNIVTLFLLIMYTFHFVEKHDRLPWQKLECFFCALMALAYITLSIIAATLGESVGYAVAFFGLCAIIAYSIDAYLKFKGWKRGLPAQ